MKFPNPVVLSAAPDATKGLPLPSPVPKKMIILLIPVLPAGSIPLVMKHLVPAPNVVLFSGPYGQDNNLLSLRW